MEALLPFVVWTFATLDRATGESHAAVSLQTVSAELHDPDGSDFQMYGSRLDLTGELAVGKGFGIIATLPLLYVRGDYDYDSFDYGSFGLGAASLGATYRARFGGGGDALLTLLPRFEVVLPTADYVTTWDPRSERRAITFTRLGEDADDGGATWLRGGLVAKLQKGAWSAQLDALARYAMGAEVESEFVDGDRPFLNVGLGLGRQFGCVQATAEVMVANRSLFHRHRSDQVLGAGALSLGGTLGDVEVRGSLGIPFNDDYRSRVVQLGLSATRTL